MLPRPFRVRSRRRETRDTFTLVLEPADSRPAPRFAPGQFHMLYTFGCGEAAISLSGDPHDTERVVHTVRAVGTVTGRAYLRSRLGTRVDPRPWPDPPPLSPTESAARIRSQGIPLLIVHGDQDAFFPLDHPDALHRAAPGSEAWIEPGFGHAEGAIDDALIDRIGAWGARPR